MRKRLLKRFYSLRMLQHVEGSNVFKGGLFFRSDPNGPLTSSAVKGIVFILHVWLK